ncbi:Uncharacterised protein [Escherichia coli]|nr:Uncharacterised protein [Escherichia coli]
MDIKKAWENKNCQNLSNWCCIDGIDCCHQSINLYHTS